MPDAYILEYMDVPTRDEVFALENALHVCFDKKQSFKYSGREWFKLTDKDIEDLRKLYQENSDGFAQASAYYGLIHEMESIKEEAEKKEQERQIKIFRNRSSGKIHDTTPKGILKRYNLLKKKSQEGILATRFSFHRIEHPIVKAMSEAREEIGDVIKEKVKGTAFIVGGVGLLSGLMIGGSIAPYAISPITWGTTIFGAIAGGFSGHKRELSEVEGLRLAMNSLVDAKHPNTRTQTLEFIRDQTEETSLLVKDYTETISVLRKQPAYMPKVDLSTTITKPLKEEYRSKSYFPKVACALTVGCSLFISGGYADDEKNGRTSFEVTPVAIERLA